MVQNGKVVSLKYRLKDSQGQEIDRSEDGQPLSYLHGAGQIVPGLEEALTGMSVGDKKQVSVSPEKGYGDVHESLKTTIDRSSFPEGQPLHPGMQFSADVGEGGSIVFTITEVGDQQVSVDGNHPLAGETLNFDVEIMAVRDATKEEIDHGHVHDGSHSHH